MPRFNHPFPDGFGPVLLLHSSGTTMALTPVCRHLGRQVSPLISLHLPDVPPPTTLCAPVSLCTPSSAYRMSFRLRHLLEGSSLHSAESSSLYCGPPVRLRLLSTPPHDDAVTFSYRALAYPDTDFHRVDVAPSWAHGEAEGRRTRTAACAPALLRAQQSEALHSTVQHGQPKKSVQPTRPHAQPTAAPAAAAVSPDRI